MLSADLRDGKGVEHRFDPQGLALSVFFSRFEIEYQNLRDELVVETPDGGEHRFWQEGSGTLVRQNGNGTSEALCFDAGQRLVSRTCFQGQGSAAIITWSSHYSYDVDGLLGQALDSELGPIRYVYDADKRLVVQHGPGAAQFDYRYDAAGNLSYTPTHRYVERLADNLLAHSHLERFEHDFRQRLAKRISHDGRETRFTYDSADQLIAVSWSDRSETWQAAYDGLGRRVWREYGGARTSCDRTLRGRAPT